MHIANIQITADNGKWQNLETLISTATGNTFTFDSGVTYYLENCSNTDIFLINTTDDIDTLDAKKINGSRLHPYGQAGLIKENGYVYCKCYNGTSADLHIEVKE